MCIRFERIHTVLIIGLLVFANINIAKGQDNLPLRLKSKPVGVIYQKNRSQKGSELLFDSWNKGEITFSDSQTIEHIDINFNAYSNDLFYAINGNTAVVVSKFQYASFKIYSEGQCREFVKISDTLIDVTANTPTILEVLHSGNIKAYANRKFKVNYTLMKNNPFGQSVYYLEESYYVIVEDELITSPQNIRSYYKFYDKAIIKQIAKSHKLNLKVEEELISFLNILDSKFKSKI